MGVLLCTTLGAASAQEEFTEDYKAGFYDAAIIIGQASFAYGNLVDLYYGLGGESVVLTPENQEVVEFYNNQSTQFNQQMVPYVNGVIFQIFGQDDERAEDLYMPELPIIS
ncbi:hypothetical protein [Candidatus Methanocrinis natronophilus]|uniref:Uncharacterized protein n=1 Tax=Candidatus Methanocrinis natronophilus TaxID=3033396 RepID=A0ABT5X801_9EURY|nr:hypothetical protein [Candidatus Methanocrinis natronophilus]MDF0590819.1 hypothetical protein [Candidatus Methanocrinis natronophilus]